MTDKEKHALILFQHEDNRTKEENFARGFTRNENVTLAFINEGRAFTDGRNITVDPEMDMMFTDRKALKNTSQFLGLKSGIRNPWTALFFTTRAQEIHECLHIIYSQFPPPASRDSRCTTKGRAAVLSLIGNIIEDAYIESAGASEYPQTEIFLRWGRASHLFANEPSKGTAMEKLREAGVISGEEKHGKAMSNGEMLEYILDRMALELLYPMINTDDDHNECDIYLEKVRPLFFTGSESETPPGRHEYARRIFDILEPLIPDELSDCELLKRLIGGTGTHDPAGNSLKEYCSEGKACRITRRLFVDRDGAILPFDEDGKQLARIVTACVSEFNESITDSEPEIIVINGGNTGASAIHKKITIKEIYPVPDSLLEKSYKKIVSQRRLTINTYINRFSKLIHTENEYTDDRKCFGTGIASKDFGDIKKRYWYKKYYMSGSSQLSVLLMIDGSGSMSGARRNAAVQACVILHEVLQSKNIEHAIVEHRAIYDAPLVEHNILFGFSAADKTKYNIMRFSAYDGTREGLSLFWAENYINRFSSTNNRIILVISDGYPAHACESSEYFPPVSVRDTANAADKISRHGVKIIAIALGAGCYDDLKGIYPKTVLCDDLDKLTGKLLKQIADEL